MLNLRHNLYGFSMIELLIGLVILGILAAIGTPALGSWIQNGRIRTSAESLQNGLQLARAEAIRRNTLIRFELTNSVTNSCARSLTSAYWVVSQLDTVGACASNPSDTAAAPDPLIIQKNSGMEGSANKLTVTASQSPIAFNGLGRQVSVANLDSTTTPNPPVSVTINISNPAGGTCRSAGGNMNCLRVVVTSGGQIRMCDPSLTQGANPKGC